VQISLQSTDRELLQQTAAKIRDGLAAGKIPGVINPDLSTKPGKPELQARPDRAKLADYDLSAGQVGLALRTMYEGDENAKFRVKGEEYDIRVMLDLEDRNNPALLDNVPVTFQSNKPIYLSDVATVTRGQGLDRIDRRNRLEEVVVQADLLPGVSFGPINDQIGQWVKDESLIPDGVIYDPVGQARVQQREFPILIGTFLTGIVLVYMVLAALYNNLVYPFIIQLAQPQALVGALLALIITDKALNVVGFIGIVALVGLVGKNAILLVDYANTLRNRGEDRDEAVIHSGRTRLRPILMTTIALIVGTLPVALAIGRGSEFRETIGITIIGGATLSTILTLFVIPCSYTIFDDLMAGGGKLWRKVFPAGEPAAVQVDD
jgi:HAE1 family hydrophobic/amphiphilic exporter-1